MAQAESQVGVYRVIPDVIIKRTGRFDYLGNSSASGDDNDGLGDQNAPQFTMDNLPGGAFKVENGQITELAAVPKAIAKKGRVFTGR